MNKNPKQSAYIDACGTLNDADLPNIYAMLNSLDSLKDYIKALDDYSDSDPRVVTALAIINAYRPIM
jgi:hypothetical protein